MNVMIWGVGGDIYICMCGVDALLLLLQGQRSADGIVNEALQTATWMAKQKLGGKRCHIHRPPTFPLHIS